ncbi:uncharacterized protein [Phaseolus vulgaris]|uniref:uncharacterized protein n=1 Tax=Phaseolus vulgaris TaxID=3885 RepID=UPI0035C974E9
MGVIPLNEVHDMWTRLSFSDLSECDSSSELSIQQEWDVILSQFKQVELCGKVTIKNKLREISYPYMTTLCAPLNVVKTKRSQKSQAKKFQRSTKCIPSYFEHVDRIYIVNDSSSSLKTHKGKVKVTTNTNAIPMLNQFHPKCHPYILDVINVKADGHCGFRAIASLLGMGEESWPLIRMVLFKEISQWREEYATLLGGHQRVEHIKRSLLVDELSMASVDKWMTIPDMGYLIASRYNIILVKMVDDCPIPTADILWCTHCYPEARLCSDS